MGAGGHGSVMSRDEGFGGRRWVRMKLGTLGGGRIQGLGDGNT